MKCLRTLCLLAVLSFAVSAFAQGGAKPATPAAPSPTPAAQAQPTPPPVTSLSEMADRQVSQYEKLLVGVAEAMPEDKYNFTPASLNIPGAAYKDVRTFAVLIKHTAAANYFFWSRATGEKMPENIKGGNGPEELKTKAEIVQFLKDSFAVGHRAAKSLTAENAMDQLPSFRGNQPRLMILTGAVIHDADEYGQMVEYLRMNGIIPPASRGSM